MVNTKGILTDDSKKEELSRGENENFIVEEAVEKILQIIRVTTEGTQGKRALLRQQDILAVTQETCWSSTATRYSVLLCESLLSNNWI